VEDVVVTDELSAAMAGYLDTAGWDVLRLSDPEEFGKGWESTIHTFTVTSVTASLLAGPEALGMRPEAAVQMREQVELRGSVYRLFQERTGLAIPEIERVLSG